MSVDYWAGISRIRLHRRRALAATGAVSLSAALLAACGGGSKDSGSKDRSGLLKDAVDTTAKAEPGGVWQTSSTDALILDPTAANSSGAFAFSVPVYSKLVKYGLGRNGQYPGPELISGEEATSWEISPDGAQVTFKLASDHKFDPRPPTNGRVMTSEDVRWSWDRMAKQSAFRGEIVNSVSPAGPVTSLTAPDKNTVVIKMAYPYGPIIEMLAYYPYLNVMPVEAEDKFNPRSEMRGTGPFRLMEYQPSSHWLYAKNPDWYGKGRPFLNGIRKTIVSEYATGMAQFETGALWDYPLRQEDVLRVKRDHSALVLQSDADGVGAPQDAWWGFSQKPNSPFRDVRVRRAASMMLDRDLWIDTYQNLKQFRDQGLPVEALWNSHMRAGQPNWLDPKSNGLGEGARFFKHDPAEARKLVNAAGFDPVKSVIHWHNNGTDKRREEIMQGMFSEGHVFDLAIDITDYNTTYRDHQVSKGLGYDGISFFMNGGYNEESWLVNMYTPGGKRAVSDKPIPKISDMVTRTRTELDKTKLGVLIKDIQKELALEMPNIIFPGFAIGFTLNWPWLKNYGVFTSGDLEPEWSSSRSYTEYWYDKSLQT